MNADYDISSSVRLDFFIIVIDFVQVVLPDETEMKSQIYEINPVPDNQPEHSPESLNLGQVISQVFLTQPLLILRQLLRNEKLKLRRVNKWEN